MSIVTKIERQSDRQSETEVLARLARWKAVFGAPIGVGRANPDNDMWYLLHDAEEVIKGLRLHARKLERCLAERRP